MSQRTGSSRSKPHPSFCKRSPPCRSNGKNTSTNSLSQRATTAKFSKSFKRYKIILLIIVTSQFFNIIFSPADFRRRNVPALEYAEGDGRPDISLHRRTNRAALQVSRAIEISSERADCSRHHRRHFARAIFRFGRKFQYYLQFPNLLNNPISGPISGLWKEAYGALSSQNNESLALYKDLMKSDRRFQQFVRSCANNPLLKKKGIPECILFVTTRITKYPLLIDPLIKTARDRPQEQQKLKDANMFVRVS